MRALLLLALLLAACAAARRQARRGARRGFSSGSRSTSGRRFRSTSPAESTGRPDAVTDADGSQSAAAADMATVLQRASLISRLRAGKAPGHGGPPQIRVGGGGAARIWDGDAEPPSMLAAARRSCREAAVLSSGRPLPHGARGGGPGGDAKTRREDAFLPSVSPPTQNACCVCLLRWSLFFAGKTLCTTQFWGWVTLLETV